MFRKTSIFSSFLAVVCLAVVGGVAQPALADSRLSLSVSSQQVFFGTATTLTSSSQISDTSNYDWSQMRYEILALQSKGFEAVAGITQSTASACAGTVSNVVGSTRLCSHAFSSKRVVLNAPATSGITLTNTLKLTQLSGDSQSFRVRSWIDRNNNDVVDPYEPASVAVSITTVDPQKARAYLGFQVDPPRFSEGKIVASTTAGVGFGRSVGILDPALVSLKVQNCGLRGCETISGALTYNSYPQLLRWEFNTPIAFHWEGKQIVELFYNQNPDLSVLMASKTFEYKKQLPEGIKTEIVAQTGFSTSSTEMLLEGPSRLNTTVVKPSVSNFTYAATLIDKNQALIARREVYVFIDLSGVKTPSNVLVNGIKITSTTRDEVLLRRFTDAKGRLELKFAYPSASVAERIEIDVQVDGMRPYELAQAGSEEALVWDLDSSRNLSLFTNNDRGTSTEPITISGIVYTDDREVIREGAVIFSADDDIIVETPVSTLNPTGRVETVIRISNLAAEVGQGFVVGQILTSTGWVSSNVLISWEGHGSTVTANVLPIATDLKGLTNVDVGLRETTVSVFGLLPSDSVVVLKNSAKYSLKAVNGQASKVFYQTIASKYVVLVNGITVYSGTHK